MDRECHYVTMQECHACMMYNLVETGGDATGNTPTKLFLHALTNRE